jgi:hypothetical protein
MDPVRLQMIMGLCKKPFAAFGGGEFLRRFAPNSVLSDTSFSRFREAKS